MHHLLLRSERAIFSVFLESRNFWYRSYISIIQKESCHSFSATSSAFRKFGSREVSELVSCNKKIASFIRSGDLDSAFHVFLGMKIRSTVTWNSILSGLSAKPGKLKDAEDLFDRIPEPDSISYNVMLSSYLKNASIDAARDFFDRIPDKDIASWNTMISGYLRNGNVDDAERLFNVMPRRNIVTWNAMISGYSEVGDMESALCLLERAPVKDVVSWTSIITGYMKSGKVELAEKIFREMPTKNLVTWNTMISGYVENGSGEHGLRLFKQMLLLGMKPNPSSFSSILLACSNFSLLKFGKLVHQLTLKSPLYYSDTTVGTSLVSMYCKCGVLEDGWKLFEEMPRKDVVTWNAMISGYAQHGVSDRALYLFNEMKARGTNPNWITFVGILSACNHAGLADLGKHFFEEMQKVYGITTKPDHYTCMIDLLSRAGRLEEAMDLINNMPFRPHPAIYGTLLGACRIHYKIEIAEFAATNLLHLEPGNPAAYVQLANVYAAKKNWEGVSRVWKSMKENKVMKTPGCTWVEIKGKMHEFRSGDRLHPELEIIHNKLKELEKKMKLAGYVPHLDSSSHDIAEEQKEELLLRHSEKLAIAYALMKLPLREAAIRVFKNLRVCQDCHLATKFISAIEDRRSSSETPPDSTIFDMENALVVIIGR